MHIQLIFNKIRVFLTAFDVKQLMRTIIYTSVLNHKMLYRLIRKIPNPSDVDDGARQVNREMHGETTTRTNM